MGVLNVTPDSFSDGGRYLDLGDAVARFGRMVDEGASVIDVGGESTRPGADPVDPDEECRRVLPVIEAVAPLAGEHGIRISIDTRHEVTARAAVAAGATLVNDISASLWHVAADTGAGWVAMHMLGDPRTMQEHPVYGDVVDDVRSFLVERATTAARAGVGEIWVDPGIGFGKTLEHNLELLGRIDELVAEGFPVLVATSRKRFTGVLSARSDAGPGPRIRHDHTLADPTVAAPSDPAFEPDSGTAPDQPAAVDDRLEASLATATWCMAAGVEMIRSHDVAETVQAAVVVGGDFPTL